MTNVRIERVRRDCDVLRPSFLSWTEKNISPIHLVRLLAAAASPCTCRELPVRRMRHERAAKLFKQLFPPSEAHRALKKISHPLPESSRPNWRVFHGTPNMRMKLARHPLIRQHSEFRLRCRVTGFTSNN
ncbi:hypothetical protein EVAR_373_1 [Eumeta japonica]|uniref:Uncharacterized protein n=1 Tax=Eumeta variegata TaxID=151549 RepID=A0A4C1SAY0_EUMVA|nr:hypothetical protein EVAR_373_1 [Eumeta japonica]